jgi:hypothetical protein
MIRRHAKPRTNPGLGGRARQREQTTSQIILIWTQPSSWLNQFYAVLTRAINVFNVPFLAYLGIPTQLGEKKPDKAIQVTVLKRALIYWEISNYGVCGCWCIQTVPLTFFILYPMPPHVLMDFVVFPPGHGSSVTDFWGWDANEAQLRCPDDVSGDIGGWSARRALKPKFY